jgi:HAD superfamily hydrolase (TIGR01509 family)
MTLFEQLDPQRIDLLVLDVHGVIFNNPLAGFMHDLGERTGEGGPELLDRWHTELRVPFWRGELDEAGLWARLAPGAVPSELRRDLELRYTSGPLFDLVNAWPQRLWILSNHRTDWLMDRLDRFGIADRFDRILVSDRLGHIKPHPEVFREVRQASLNASVFFVDDQQKNISAARQLAIPAALADAVTERVTLNVEGSPVGSAPDEASAGELSAPA